MAEFKRILHATDFSDLSAWALGYATYLAETCGAELHVVHVVDDSYQYWAAVDADAVPAGPPVEQVLAAAEKQLDRLAAERVPGGVRVVTEALHGRASLEIIRYARDREADLIVMGTHGRTGLRHVLLGSVAEKVVRKSPCPVLTVRHPDHAFEMP